MKRLKPEEKRLAKTLYLFLNDTEEDLNQGKAYWIIGDWDNCGQDGAEEVLSKWPRDEVFEGDWEMLSDFNYLRDVCALSGCWSDGDDPNYYLNPLMESNGGDEHMLCSPSIWDFYQANKEKIRKMKRKEYERPLERAA